jgi:hypothetical protein
MNSRQFALKVSLSIRVTPEMAERLFVVAEKLNCSISKAASLAVIKGIDELEARPPEDRNYEPHQAKQLDPKFSEI